jgi:hypothetical protein
MKRHYIVALVLALASVVIAFADQPNLPTQNGYPVVINFGFKDVATPTITINNAIVDLADYLPAGTIGFELRCASGSFVIGHPDNIATGTSRVGRLISAGESYTWNGNANSFIGSVLGTASSTIIVFDAVWGQYER